MLLAPPLRGIVALLAADLACPIGMGAITVEMDATIPGQEVQVATHADTADAGATLLNPQPLHPLLWRQHMCTVSALPLSNEL